MLPSVACVNFHGAVPAFQFLLYVTWQCLSHHTGGSTQAAIHVKKIHQRTRAASVVGAIPALSKGCPFWHLVGRHARSCVFSCLSMQFFLGQQVCWYGLYPCPFWPGTQSHAPYITNTHTNSRLITRESFLASCGGHFHANACSPMHKYAYFLHLSFVSNSLLCLGFD